MKLNELEAKEDSKSWLELRWLQVHGWYDTIADLECDKTKLTQAVNDKDLELFESQELVAALLETLQTLSAVADTPYPIDKQWLSHFVTEAIHKVLATWDDNLTKITDEDIMAFEIDELL